MAKQNDAPPPSYFNLDPEVAAAKLPDHVSESVMNERRDRLMAEQQQIAFAWTDAQIGRQFDVLIDAPPQKLEVQFRVAVQHNEGDQHSWLSDISPVVNSLATQQFDNYVKQVRVFVNPDVADGRSVPAGKLAEFLSEV